MAWKSIGVTFHEEDDAEFLKWLDEQPNKAAAIRSIVQAWFYDATPQQQGTDNGTQAIVEILAKQADIMERQIQAIDRQTAVLREAPRMASTPGATTTAGNGHLEEIDPESILARNLLGADDIQM